MFVRIKNYLAARTTASLEMPKESIETLNEKLAEKVSSYKRLKDANDELIIKNEELEEKCRRLKNHLSHLKSVARKKKLVRK
jgi:predicted nuclease with TOPRIM domain